MLLVMMYELILLYVIGVIVDLLELLDSLELLVMLYDGIIGYVLDVILVYVFDPGVAGVVIVWGLSCRLNMDHQIKNTGKKSANKKVK